MLALAGTTDMLTQLDDTLTLDIDGTLLNMSL